MKNRYFGSVLLLLIAAAALLVGCTAKSGVPGAAIADIMTSKPLVPTQVRPEGEFGTRAAAATIHLLTWTDLYSLESFVASATGKPGALWWDWPGDQIGRWLSFAMTARGYGWCGEAWPPEALADAVLPHQSRDGNFGPPASAAAGDVRLLSGNAFALRGFMDAYAATRDSRWLEGARRLGRYFERIAPAWESKRDGLLHEFYGHCIDGLVALYEQAGDRWALDAAIRIAPRAGRTPHTHHTLSLMRGLVDLARVTKETRYLEPVKDYLAWCRENGTVTGGLPESMPSSEQDEGCGLADWIVVNLMMAQTTGEDRFFDEAERTLVNHFFMNQFHTGGFGHLTFAQDIVGGKLWQGWGGRFGSENPGCCSLWGAWALGQAGRFFVTESDDAVFVNLYPSASISLPGKAARVGISGDFPRSSAIRVSVMASESSRFTLALRVPAWAEEAEVICGGVAVPAPQTGRRVLIRRDWEGRTDVEVRFKSGLRLVPWPESKPIGTGIFDGPLCLGLSAREGDPSLAWAIQLDAAGRPALDERGRPQAVDTSGSRIHALEPVSAGWLIPDVKDPIKRRILFQTRKQE